MRYCSGIILSSLILVGFLGCKQRSFNGGDVESTAGACALGAVDGQNVDSFAGSSECVLPVWPLASSECKRNEGDRLEFGSRMLFGPFAKSSQPPCIDKSQMRPVLVLAPVDAARFGFRTDVQRSHYGDSARAHLLGANFSQLETLAVANIEDIDDQLQVAQIPVGKIRDVYFHIEKFVVQGMTGAHAQLRVLFDEPVLLRPQFPASKTSPVREVRDLILSVNAVRPPGVAFDPAIAGMNDSFASVWGVSTLRERYLDSYLRQKNPTEQWRLRLSKVQAKKLVLSYLGLSEFFDYRRVYHTMLQSCGTEQFYNIDSSIGADLGVNPPANFTPYRPQEGRNRSVPATADGWDPPRFFTFPSGIDKVAMAALNKGVFEAVADMFPLFAADGFPSVAGPLRDRKLIGPQATDRLVELQDDPSLKAIHETLCAMAPEKARSVSPQSWAATVWNAAAKTCAGE